ncbi:MAG TPA: SIMPL domain-containing protein [Anaerolineae bacterium]|nr:SIMPL domain-containing protein [Anaerolineae bacterium]
MKDKAVTIVSVALLLVLGLSAWTQAHPAVQVAAAQPAAAETRRIAISGEAEVRVVPDEVIVTLGVETWNKNLEIARTENDTVVQKVLALTQELGIAGQHVQTDYINIEPRYRSGYYEESDFIGYFVHKNIVVTLRDLSRFEDLLAGALDAGANYVHGVQFRTTELRQHRDEARALAIAAAREKAVALAGELGQKIGEPLLIHEEQAGWWSGYNSWWGARFGGGMTQNTIQEVGGVSVLADSTVAPGQIAVSARVAVTFEITN